MSKPSCFIIMPLTTPAHLVDTYKGDSNHFIHVLDHLFKPAIEAAGLTPIPPISKGSKVIHGDIIQNIETADLVLCDMSILNPNVFFELGIRTALNKPVALVRDNTTEKVPFDLNMINHHTYDGSLSMAVWNEGNEIKKLTGHLKDCMEKGSNNSLWGHFSMTQQAEIPNDAPEVEKQLAYLIKQVESLREQTSNSGTIQSNDLGRIDKIVGKISSAESSTLAELFKLFGIPNTEKQQQGFVKELFILKDMGLVHWDGSGINENTRISATNKKKQIEIGKYLLS